MDPISIGAVVAGARAGIEVIKQAADAVTAIRTAAKGPEGHKTAPVDLAKLDELSDSLFLARVRAMDMLDVAEQLQADNRELRSRVDKSDRFAARSTQYRLTKFKEGAVAYEFNGNGDSSIAHHLACPTCFEDERVSILQPEHVGFGTTQMACPICKTSVSVANDHHGQTYIAQTDWSPHDF